VRAGVSSGGRKPNSKEMAGKRRARGAGGVIRNNSQSTGSPASARSSQGWVKANAVKLVIGRA
jgi:hypothetical protein